MKALIGLVVVLVLFSGGCRRSAKEVVDAPQARPDQVQVTRLDSDTGEKEIETVYYDSNGNCVRHGPGVIYSRAGKKLAEWSYKEGKLHGRLTFYREDGRVEFTGWYREGQPWEGVIQIRDSLGVFHKGKMVRQIMPDRPLRERLEDFFERILPRHRAR